eukprot:3221446-Amphidinium_carterae.1
MGRSAYSYHGPVHVAPLSVFLVKAKLHRQSLEQQRQLEEYYLEAHQPTSPNAVLKLVSVQWQLGVKSNVALKLACQDSKRDSELQEVRHESEQREMQSLRLQVSLTAPRAPPCTNFKHLHSERSACDPA